MSAFLRISFSFHDARFHGQRNGGEPEWPPSPLRVYQAIVAACAARSSLDQARAALRWFEEQLAPIIVAPNVFHAKPYRIAVPNNDMDVPARFWAKGQDAPRYKTPQDLKSLKTVCPGYFDGGSTVHYLYRLADPLPAAIAAHLKVLATVAPSITHLGWGIDMVAARAEIVRDEKAAHLPGRRWNPVNHSSTHLRAPRAGTLDALIDRHDAFLRRVTEDGYTPVPALSGFGIVAYDDTDRTNRRPFAAFDLVPADTKDRRLRTSFRQQDAIRVGAMLRHCAWEMAKNDLGDWRTAQWAEQFVAGHGPHKASESFSRFSYIPVPTIGHSHADGMIRRAILAETSDGDGRSAAWAEQRLGGLALCDERDGSAVALLKVTKAAADPVLRMYCAAHDRWQTITPIILPGFDDNDRAKRLKLLVRCFEQIGIPPELIADLDVQKVPWLRASVQTRSYKRSDRLQHLPACHLRVYFKHLVAGPLVVGAGRHRGLGVLAAWD